MAHLDLDLWDHWTISSTQKLLVASGHRVGDSTGLSLPFSKFCGQTLGMPFPTSGSFWNSS